MEDDFFDQTLRHQALKLCMVDVCRYLSIEVRETEVFLDAITLRFRNLIRLHNLLDLQHFLDEFLILICIALLHRDLSNQTKSKGEENIACVDH